MPRGQDTAWRSSCAYPYLPRSIVTLTEPGTARASTPDLHLPHDDDAWCGDSLPVMAIQDRDVSAGRRIDHVTDVVAPHTRSILRDRPLKLAPFFPAEQVVHRQGQGQQGDKVLRRLAAQSGWR